MAENDPRRTVTDVTPPSRVLDKDTGMVSQADVAASQDEELERQRRDNINPSLAREQPPDVPVPKGAPGEAAPKRTGWWQKDPKGRESSLDHPNMHPDNLKTKDM
ncbi:MAG TPA: hypothetical protein VD978_19055 [Azospirillum sp.]|nr:hypothetical protein [Azospirillum sp.]